MDIHKPGAFVGEIARCLKVLYLSIHIVKYKHSSTAMITCRKEMGFVSQLCGNPRLKRQNIVQAMTEAGQTNWSCTNMG